MTLDLVNCLPFPPRKSKSYVYSIIIENGRLVMIPRTSYADLSACSLETREGGNIRQAEMTDNETRPGLFVKLSIPAVSLAANHGRRVSLPIIVNSSLFHN